MIVIANLIYKIVRMRPTSISVNKLNVQRPYRTKGKYCNLNIKYCIEVQQMLIKCWMGASFMAFPLDWGSLILNSISSGFFWGFQLISVWKPFSFQRRGKALKTLTKLRKSTWSKLCVCVFQYVGTCTPRSIHYSLSEFLFNFDIRYT